MAITQRLTGSSARQARRARPLISERALRLGSAVAVGLALVAFLFGTAWDIQWHPSVGRDRPLTLPHVLMLGGIMGAGLLGLALVLIDSWRARRGGQVSAENSVRLLRIFRAPLGAVAIGAGALLATVAFPLDDYWHTLYGIDVTLWAPFHAMIITSMMLLALGLLFLLGSELNRTPHGAGRRGLELGVSASIALLLATTLLFIPQASVAEGLGAIGDYQLALFPVLLAASLPLGLLPALLITRRPGAATAMALVFIVLRQLLYWFVPWAMEVAVAAEGLAYRPNAPTQIITPYNYPSWLLLGALLSDGAYWLARRRSVERAWPLALAVAGIAVLLTFLDQPWARIIVHYYPGLDTQQIFWNALPFTVLAAGLGSALALLLSRGVARTHQ